jgi:hypothetical protein
MSNAPDKLRELADRLEAKADETRGKSAAALANVVVKLESIAAKIEAGEEVEDEEEVPAQLPAEPTDEEPHVEHRA